MSDDLDAALNSAHAARRDNRMEDARRAFADAARLAHAQGDPGRRAYALRHLSDLDRALGDAAAALAHAQQAVALYRAGAGEPLDLANALRLEAMALDRLGRADEARPLWAEAGAGYAGLGVAAGAAECAERLRI